MPLYYSKLWHDDVRPPPEPKDDNTPFNWYWARTNKEAVAYLLHVGHAGYACDEASLDHDLGGTWDPDDPTITRVKGHSPDGDGTDLAYVMYYLQIVPNKITIHSWNDSGAARMAAILREAGAEVTINPYREPSMDEETHLLMHKNWPR